MNRIRLILLSFLFTLGILSNILTPLLVNAAEVNLIANPSVETASGTTPLNWTANKWGTNTTTLAYTTTGHTGKGLKVAMTARTDGDAKWMHDAVTVKPNTSYTYTSWYKATGASELDLQYTDTTGKNTYAYVDTMPASSTWVAFSRTFTTPANAAKISIMHLVSSVSTLETDDFNLSATVTAPVDQDNLIANGSFETANGVMPASWFNNKWGTNTASFTYGSTGRTGSRSATVSMTSFTNGDAKWYAAPVTVTPTKSYLYRDFYKASVVTRVVVAFQDAAGAYTYQDLTDAPLSASTWAQYSATITAPSTAVKASVYHLIDRVGTLSIDDVSMSVALPAPTGPTIANPSMETSANNLPSGWTSSNWGTNTPKFEYVNEGQSGTKSTKVTVTNYKDGDAKWYFEPITTLKVGSQYRVTAWYKTNVAPHPVAMFNMADGSTQYFGLPIAQPAANSTTVWQKYSDTFTVPAGAVSSSVFFYISQNGWLQTDNYSLTPYSPTGFSRPLLTLTFDDGHEDNATNALPILNKYGLKSTQCYATQFLEGQSQAVINGALAFSKSGHEICSHTVTHPFLTTTTPTALTYELSHSKQYLEKLIGKPVLNFASPYGDYDARVVTEVKKYYQSHRSVDEGYNSKDNFNAYDIRVQNILDTTTPQQVAAWIAHAQADKTWLVLVYHRVANNPGPYDSYIADFDKQIQAVVSSGITVKTYNDAFIETKAQL
ncbi:MAG: hypothetical protein JWN33_318 [Candidatus Saccharibacteria bacterium]|nr:hypothetical protein [Candidatus Saccharibacteria bacterium]